jgi:hypothetical protein
VVSRYVNDSIRQTVGDAVRDSITSMQTAGDVSGTIRQTVGDAVRDSIMQTVGDVSGTIRQTVGDAVRDAMRDLIINQDASLILRDRDTLDGPDHDGEDDGEDRPDDIAISTRSSPRSTQDETMGSETSSKYEDAFLILRDRDRLDGPDHDGEDDGEDGPGDIAISTGSSPSSTQDETMGSDTSSKYAGFDESGEVDVLTYLDLN